MRPERANYWQSFDPTEIVERTQLFEEIEPKFNRLTIFDPRLPHGVREVKGTKDVSKGRLVLNGWFNEPAISCQGGLTIEDVGKVLDAKLDLLYEELETLPAMIGFAALRMEIEAETGHVDSISWGRGYRRPGFISPRPKRGHGNERCGVSDYSWDDE